MILISTAHFAHLILLCICFNFNAVSLSMRCDPIIIDQITIIHYIIIISIKYLPLISDPATKLSLTLIIYRLLPIQDTTGSTLVVAWVEVIQSVCTARATAPAYTQTTEDPIYLQPMHLHINSRNLEMVLRWVIY